MADENPYKVVVEALAAQTVAIGRLAKEIRVEFAQYQAAKENQDEARAEAIAAAINSRTATLEKAADALAASVPGAEVGGGPVEPPPVVGGGPIEPPFNPAEPPEKPGGQPDRPVAPDRPPGSIDRPSNELPGDQPGVGGGPAEPPPVVGGGPVEPPFDLGGTPPDRPGPPLTPGGGPIDRPGTPGTPPERPTPAPPVIDYVAPSTVKPGDLVGIQVVGSLFYDGATVYLDGEPATKTIYVSENEVRFNDVAGGPGEIQVTVDDSNAVTLTVAT